MLTGIYELPLDLMASESGIDQKDLTMSMLHRLEPKIFYKEGWVIIKNYPNHRVSDSPKLISGILNAFQELPPQIRELSKSLGYPIDTLSIHINNRIDKNRIDTSEVRTSRSIVPEKAETEKASRPERRVRDKNLVFALFSKTAQPWMYHKQQREAAIRLFDLKGIEKIKNALGLAREYQDDPYCPQPRTPFELEEKWESLVKYKNRLSA